MGKKLKRWKYQLLTLSALLLGLCQAGQAQQAPSAPPPAASVGGAVTLYQNVRIFDGRSGALSGPTNVLVRGNKIERIGTGPMLSDRSASTVVIDGGGRTLMPGLIDMHWHAMMVRPTPAALSRRISVTPLCRRRRGHGHADARVHHRSRMGGPAFGLKRAIDEGTRRRSAHLSRPAR